jgi:hypothetical protein
MEYENYIKECKKTKDALQITRIVEHIIIGVRKKYSTRFLAERLNKYKIFSIMNRLWTPSSLHVQIRKIYMSDPCSSIAMEFKNFLNTGRATEEDVLLLSSRVRKC